MSSYLYVQMYYNIAGEGRYKIKNGHICTYKQALGTNNKKANLFRHFLTSLEYYHHVTNTSNRRGGRILLHERNVDNQHNLQHSMKRGLDSSATNLVRRKRFQRVMNELFDDSVKNQAAKDL